MKEKTTGICITFGVLKILFFVLLVFLLASFGRKAYQFGYSIFAQQAVSLPPGKDVAVTLDEGMSGRELAGILKEKGLIRDENVFYIQLLLSDDRDRLKKGSYLLNTSQTADEMLKVLAKDTEAETES